MLETLRGRLDDLRIGSRMCHTLVQARTARLIGGSTSDEFGRPSYDCRMFTSLDSLEHERVLKTNLCGVIGVSDIDIQTHDVDSSTCDGGRVPRSDGVAWGVTSVRGCLGVLVDTPIVHAPSWSDVR